MTAPSQMTTVEHLRAAQKARETKGGKTAQAFKRAQEKTTARLLALRPKFP